MRSLHRLSAHVLVPVGLLITSPAWAASGGPDPFGYSWRDSNQSGGPAYQWIDISGSGQSLASGSDEGGVVRDGAPLFIYGKSFSRFAVSRHGYVSTNDTDDGGDSTNDCNLPLNPSPRSWDGDRPNRIYVTHDLLEFGAGGEILHQYDPVSPHAHDNCGVHIITWKNVRHPSDPPRSSFSMQVLLFDNFDILMQFRGGVSGGHNDGSTSTTGIQRDTLQAGLQIACNTPGSIQGNRAILIEPPRLVVTTNADEDDDPAGADLSLREAIRDAPEGARIEFAPALSGQSFLLDQKLRITGGRELSLDAGGGDPILLVSPLSSVDGGRNPIIETTVSHLHLNNIKFLNSDAANIAAAIERQGATVIVASHCCFENHLDHALGGYGASAYLVHCDFRDNRTTPGVTDERYLGGGAVNAALGIAFAYQCEFVSNHVTRPDGFLQESLPQGGAVRCNAGIFDQCVFRSNSAEADGGAVYASSGVTATDCEFDANLAFRPAGTVDPVPAGGAVRCGGTSTFEHCLFRSNTSEGDGGAVHGSHLVFRSCQLDGNAATSAVGDGGAVSAATSLNIESSVFEGNTAARRGGGFDKNGAGDLRIVNSAFGNNEGLEGGAGYLGFGDSVGFTEVRHSTFAGNRGGGVQLGPSVDRIEFEHTAFERNTDAQGTLRSVIVGVGVLVVDGGYNLFDDAPAGFNGTGTQTNTSAALAVSPFYLPRSSSPLIDAGDPSFPGSPSLDIRDFPREDGVIDIGCYETVGSVVVTTAIDENVSPGTGVSLREALGTIPQGGRVVFDPSLSGAVIDAVSTHTVPNDAVVSAEGLANGITIDVSGLSTGVRLLPGSTLVGVNVRDANSVGIDAGNRTTVTDSEISGCRIGLLAKGDLTGGPGRGRFNGENLRIFRNGGNGVTAVEIRDRTEAFFEGCEFFENTCLNENGGAIRIGVGGYLRLGSCSVVDNRAETGHGGGIYVGTTTSVLLDRTTVARNRSGDDGGGLFHEGTGGLSATTSTLSQNVADRAGTSCNGGAIFAGPGVDVFLTNSTVVQNHARDGAGAIGIDPARSLVLKGTIMAANTVGGTGVVDHFRAGTHVVSDGYNLVDTTNELSAGTGDLIGFAPHLAPLSYYGHADGRKMLVHAPLAISPVIDADLGGNQGGVDQRGYPRSGDGVPGGNWRKDIGAVEAQTPVVVTTALDQPGNAQQVSLREALGMAGDGGRIIFDSSVSGQMIRLRSSQGGQGSALSIPDSIQIDATTLPRGVTINGGVQLRGFFVSAEVQAALHAVSITEARRGGSGSGAWGSAIKAFAGSAVTFTHGCIYNNQNANSAGTVTVTDGSLVLFNSSIVDNFASTGGGAIFLNGDSSARIEHSAVVYNGAGAGNSGGFSMGTSPIVAYSSIFADNTNANGTKNFNTSDNNVSFSSRFTSLGYNLTNNINGALVDVGFDGPGDLRRSGVLVESTATDAGGWSFVASTRSGAPAQDAGDPRTPRLPVFDQRGFARVAGTRIDIGPFELDGDTQDRDRDRMPDWWEDFWGFDSDDPRDAGDDADRDGDDNATEFGNGTNPREANPVEEVFNVTVTNVSIDPATDALRIDYLSETDVTVAIEISSSLDQWDPWIPSFDLSAGSHFLLFARTGPLTGDRLFLRFAER